MLGYRHWRQCRHQLAVVHVYFGPQLEISRTGVSIKSTAGRPSGWALPRILVFIYITCWAVAQTCCISQCCKDDHQMENGKIWHSAHQKPLNRSSPNLIHMITSWVPIIKQNLDAIRTGVSFPHIREIYTLCSHVYYTFFVFWYF